MTKNCAHSSCGSIMKKSTKQIIKNLLSQMSDRIDDWLTAEEYFADWQTGWYTGTDADEQGGTTTCI